MVPRTAWKRLVTLGVAALIATTVSCADEEEPRELKSLSPSERANTASSSSTPTATPTEGMSDREQIRTVYVDFLTHYTDAQDVPRGKKRRQFLAQWLVEPALSGLTKDINKQQDKGERSSGHLEPNIMTIVVDGKKTEVNDCIDQRQFLVKNKKGKVVRGGDPDYFWGVTFFRQTDRGWRIHYVASEDKKCVPE